jgi:hypothetical protein
MLLDIVFFDWLLHPFYCTRSPVMAHGACDLGMFLASGIRPASIVTWLLKNAV